MKNFIKKNNFEVPSITATYGCKGFCSFGHVVVEWLVNLYPNPVPIVIGSEVPSILGKYLAGSSCQAKSNMSPIAWCCQSPSLFAFGVI